MSYGDFRKKAPVVPLSGWPRSDRERWLSLLNNRDPLAPKGPGSGYAENTNKALVHAYGAFLGYLSGQEALDPERSMVDRLTSETFPGYVAHMRRYLRDSTVWKQIRHLRSVLSFLAPERAWEWLLTHAAGPTVREARIAAKPTCSFDFRDLLVKVISALHELDGEPVYVGKAIVYRDLVLVLVLLCLPLRRSNVARMQVGQHVVVREETVHLRIDAEEAKTREPISGPILPPLDHHLRTWIKRYRPSLINGSPTDALWLTESGQPLSYHSHYFAIVRVTKRLLGKEIHPHAFRHASATLHGMLSAKNITDSAALLGHRNLSTTYQYYDKSGDSGVMRSHLERIERIRKGQQR